MKDRWLERWNEVADEQEANESAARIKAKTLDEFHRKLVQAFGAFDRDCAEYLWKKRRLK